MNAYSHVSADIIVALHFAFVIFTVLGGFLVLRWKVLAWIHVPAVVWAVLIEFGGWICPLTPLENLLRVRGGGSGYESGFVEHYILPLLYPSTLTRPLQIALGVLVLGINLGIYWRVFRGKRILYFSLGLFVLSFRSFIFFGFFAANSGGNA